MRIFSDDHKRKLRKKHNLKSNLPGNRKGIVMSDEQKRKISQCNIGKNKGRKSPLLGRHLSEYQKKKLSGRND